ncbi:hypothetical protein DFH06DRAFT_1146961 [Mycena polygramma]|nr:hypothetical protein DFH06DRAFT_1146961 [Mycena polygramma]
MSTMGKSGTNISCPLSPVPSVKGKITSARVQSTEDTGYRWNLDGQPSAQLIRCLIGASTEQAERTMALFWVVLHFYELCSAFFHRNHLPRFLRATRDAEAPTRPLAPSRAPENKNKKSKPVAGDGGGAKRAEYQYHPPPFLRRPRVRDSSGAGVRVREEDDDAERRFVWEREGAEGRRWGWRARDSKEVGSEVHKTSSTCTASCLPRMQDIQAALPAVVHSLLLRRAEPSIQAAWPRRPEAGVRTRRRSASVSAAPVCRPPSVVRESGAAASMGGDAWGTGRRGKQVKVEVPWTRYRRAGRERIGGTSVQCDRVRPFRGDASPRIVAAEAHGVLGRAERITWPAVCAGRVGDGASTVWSRLTRNERFERLLQSDQRATWDSATTRNEYMNVDRILSHSWCHTVRFQQDGGLFNGTNPCQQIRFPGLHGARMLGSSQNLEDVVVSKRRVDTATDAHRPSRFDGGMAGRSFASQIAEPNQRSLVNRVREKSLTVTKTVQKEYTEGPCLWRELNPPLV